MFLQWPFSVIQWNARGIRSKRSWFNSWPFISADVFVIQESFLKVGDLFSLSNKCIFRNDRVSRGGGLLIAVNRNFPVSVIPLANLQSTDVEVMAVKLWTGAHWVSIVNVYSPEGKFCRSWLNSLLQQLPSPFLILGDFNLKHRAWGNGSQSPGADLLLDWIVDNDLCLLNSSQATHLAPSGSSSLIDLSLASTDLVQSCSTSVYHDLFDSDHYPVCIQVSGSSVCPSVRVYHTDWPSVYSNLNHCLEASDNISIEALQSEFHSIRKSCSTKVNFRAQDNPPWWDVQCAWLLGQKRRFLRLARTNLSREHWVAFKRFSARLRRYMKSRAKSHWSSLCENAAGGKLHRIFRAINSRGSESQSSLVLELDGDVVADSGIQAEAFAFHFSQDLSLPRIPYDISCHVDYWSKDFSLADLNSAIQLTKSTTPGEDGINANCYKFLGTSSRIKILELYNRLFHGGIVPEVWRTAVILPVWKHGRPKSLVSSYRPISLTAVGCKIMERMLLKRMLDWAMTKDCFHDRHFGFLPGRDCSKALKILLHDIQGARLQKNTVVAVKLDIDSAYDSVWRDGLMFKLANVGIGGDTALWISRWLSGRRIKVRWRGFTSSPVCSDRGVPQGSVLSPFLFMVFLYDFFDLFDSEVQVVVYADDLVIYVSGVCFQVVMRKLQEMLLRIQAWCDYWHLRIRADKCAAMHFSRSSGLPEEHLRLHGSNIAWHRDLKILGLTFSSNLTFAAHFGDVQQKCLRRLNVVKVFTSSRWGVRTPEMIRMVNALIRGVIEYAAPLYGCASKTSLHSLDVLYNAALRIGLGLPRWTPILKLFRESGQVPLDIRRWYLTQSFSIGCARVCRNLGHRKLFFPEDFRWKTSFGSVSPPMLIPSPWPFGCLPAGIEICTSGLPFQSRSFPPALVRASFSHYLYSFYGGYNVIATDASKDLDKTSIAALDVTHDVGKAHLVHHINSVFTAEVLALDLGIRSFVVEGNYIILSDSRSALEAMKKVHPRSSAVILSLFHSLRQVWDKIDKLVFLWVPGHVGIQANEDADALARSGPFSTITYGGVSPDDLSSYFRTSMRSKADAWWLSGKYSAVSGYLGPGFYQVTRNRHEDVVMARFRTLCLVTEFRLFSYHLRTSPVCAICNADPGTEFHYVFKCRSFAAERSLLCQRLNVPFLTESWSWLWSVLYNSPPALRLFIDLLIGTGRF